MRKLRIAVCFPWYKGPDENTFMSHFALQHYFGKLEERSRHPYNPNDRPLTEEGDAELGMLFDAAGEQVELDFVIAAATNIGLAGMSRELVTSAAIDMGADILFSYDYDMRFGPGVFMRLLCDVVAKDPDVPVVAALAFTGKKPLSPVIYSVKHPEDGVPHFEAVFDYKRDALHRYEAFGTGVFMARIDAFRKIPQPWFLVNSSMGEDLFFTGVRCYEHGIPVYVDTRAKVLHKPTVPAEWHGEELYDAERKAGQNG